MGKTGQAILRAMVAGERDGAVLARLRDRRVKADEATIARSLEGPGARSICSRWPRRWSVTTFSARRSSSAKPAWTGP